MGPKEVQIEAVPGDNITGVAREAVEAIVAGAERVTFDFNGIKMVVTVGMIPGDVVADYHRQVETRHEAYVSTPEYKRRQREAEEARRRTEAARADVLAMAPAHMSLRDPDGWAKACAANTDGYGGAVMTFAERWARIMEARIAAGETVAACAQAACSLADVEGITGFMYGCAVSTLAAVWAHGEELRRWHNLDTQIGNEGEKANESGGVLNPALLSIG